MVDNILYVLRFHYERHSHHMNGWIRMKPSLNFAVRELHIDLLFLEEFYSSEPFRNWFVSYTVGLEKRVSGLIRAEHSVIELERESDLEIAFSSPVGEILFLIENKINAQFQKEQAEAYKNRASEYVRRGKCSECYTVLLAPGSYITSVKSKHKFDYYISFEDIITYFSNQNNLGDRAAYKIEVLQKAINKLGQSNSQSGSSYTPAVVNSGITLFWLNYWEDISERFPKLKMDRPGIKGPGATFIPLAKDILPPKVNIWHKFTNGFVDLQFESLGTNSEMVIETFREHIEKEMALQKTGKSSVVIRITVPKINPHMNFGDIREDVRKGQDAADCLFDWFNRHSDLRAKVASTFQETV